MTKKKAKTKTTPVAETAAPGPSDSRREAIAAINARVTEAETAAQAEVERRLDSVSDWIHQNEENRKAFFAELPNLERALKEFLRVDWKNRSQRQPWSRIVDSITQLQRICGKGPANFDLQRLLGRAYDDMTGQAEETWRRAIERQVKSAAPTLGFAKKLVQMLDEDIAKYASQKGRVVNSEAIRAEPPRHETSESQPAPVKVRGALRDYP